VPRLASDQLEHPDHRLLLVADPFGHHLADDPAAWVAPDARSPQAPSPQAARVEHSTSARDSNLRDIEHLRYRVMVEAGAYSRPSAMLASRTAPFMSVVAVR
jgi:hypothetical protein